MKYISFTFDDGRKDNYDIAFPIMKSFDLSATLFCTTGYIDGSFRSEDWKSAEAPLTINELKELKQSGWEIALHGDCHTTNLQDSLSSKKKMEDWDLKEISYGFSIPNSNASVNDVSDIANSGFISYIRKGRNTDTSTLFAKILFGLYTYLKSKKAYKKFNAPNTNTLPLKNKYDICSLVIRRGDNPKFISDFIKAIPDNTWTVFMFHSILPKANEKYNADPWTYSDVSFEKICAEMKQLQNENICKVVTMQDMIKGGQKCSD